MPTTIIRRKIYGKPTIEFTSYLAMKQRCLNPKAHAYENYGGRGITICDRWRNSFDAFYLDMGPRPSRSYSLERIDNDKGYEPGNCKWATRVEQRRNTRFNRLLTLNGRTQPQSAWAEESGIDWDTLYRRLERGWSVERSVSTPKAVKRPRLRRQA